MLFKNPSLSLTLFRLGRGGGGAESARANFNFRELPWYLSNTYQMWQLLLNLLENKILQKFCVKGITCCHGNRVFDTMLTQILIF